jgi:hypothetical protein
LVNTLTSGGAKVVANIPYVNTLPFFYVYSDKSVPLNAVQVALNPLFGAMNSILASASQPARLNINSELLQIRF